MTITALTKDLGWAASAQPESTCRFLSRNWSISSAWTNERRPILTSDSSPRLTSA